MKTRACGVVPLDIPEKGMDNGVKGALGETLYNKSSLWSDRGRIQTSSIESE